jgi:uncharacterized protein
VQLPSLETSGHSYITTEFVLLELADALSKPQYRDDLKSVLALIKRNRSFGVIPASTELFKRGLAFFLDRADKEWQLTDCISFVIMTDEGIREALTADRHFEQAGFDALLKPAA